MNEDPKPTIDPELEVRIVAMVLGEASDFEAEQLRQMINERPELAAFESELLAVDDLVRIATESESIDGGDWKLPDDRREDVLSTIDGSHQCESLPGTFRSAKSSSSPISRIKHVAVFAATTFAVLIVANMMLPAVRKSRLAATMKGGTGIEVSAEPMEGAPAAGGADFGSERLAEDWAESSSESAPAPLEDPSFFDSSRGRNATMPAIVARRKTAEADSKSVRKSVDSSKALLSEIRDNLATSVPPREQSAAGAADSMDFYFEGMPDEARSGNTFGVQPSPQPSPNLYAQVPRGSTVPPADSKQAFLGGVAVQQPSRPPIELGLVTPQVDSVRERTPALIAPGPSSGKSQNRRYSGYDRFGRLSIRSGAEPAPATANPSSSLGYADQAKDGILPDVELKEIDEFSLGIAGKGAAKVPSVRGVQQQMEEYEKKPTTPDSLGDNSFFIKPELEEMLIRPDPNQLSTLDEDVAGGVAGMPYGMQSPGGGLAGGELASGGLAGGGRMGGGGGPVGGGEGLRFDSGVADQSEMEMMFGGKATQKLKKTESDQPFAPPSENSADPFGEPAGNEPFEDVSGNWDRDGLKEAEIQLGRDPQKSRTLDIAGLDFKQTESGLGEMLKSKRSEGESRVTPLLSIVAEPSNETEPDSLPATVRKGKRILGRGFVEADKSIEDSLSRVREGSGRTSALGIVPQSLDEKNASDESFSTFSLHVSDVSFKLARAALANDQWPEAEKVRIEEFVNAFDYGDPMPGREEKVSCRLEQAAHPFLQQRNLLRVSMRTAAAGRSGATPLRLTLLLDNSGSMERLDRQETVRRAFSLLAAQLKPIDQVTLISFARTPRLLADGLNGSQATQLVSLIEDLPSEGGTNLEAALQLAFEKAKEQQNQDAQNRIILLTDGAVNLGNANPESLSKKILTMRSDGIAFDAAGISANGLNDEVLEALTRKGDGRYYLLDSIDDCDAGFARQIAGALRPAAKNVKVQIEFNPRRVGNYKLLGFEKHRLETEDFRNDKVDAAEMAAAEAGVALYQFEAMPDGEGDIGSVSVRFQDLSTGQMIEKRWPIPYEADAPGIEFAPSQLKIASAAALFAAKLRGEPLGESVDLRMLARFLSTLPTVSRSQRVNELQDMIQQARQLSGN
ncbi:MAG: von Willebrand factor type A domain-containing protein [Planctomycetota bacterium]